jgi:hypothetical protein
LAALTDGENIALVGDEYFAEEIKMKFRAFAFAITLLLMGSLSSLAFGQAAVREVRGPIWISMPSSAGALQSITVKPGASGNVILTVTGSVVWEHNSGTQGNYCLQVSTTSGNVGGCVPDVGSDSAIRNYIAADYPTTVAGFGQTEQYSIVRTFPVTAGTTYTFYLNGYGSGFIGAWLFQPAMTALYVPATLAP